MASRRLTRTAVIVLGLIWIAAEITLVIVGVNQNGFVNYVDSGNAASVVTASPFLAVGAWHLWSERRHNARHEELKRYIAARRTNT